MGIVLIIFGVVSIVGGVVGKNFRHADVIALGEFGQKSPKWLGKLVFILVGLGLVGMGIKLLLPTE